MKQLKWHTFAGGAGAAPGKHSYQAITGGLNGREQYTVDPVSNNRGQHMYYVLRYFGAGGWRTLQTFARAATARKFADHMYKHDVTPNPAPRKQTEKQARKANAIEWARSLHDAEISRLLNEQRARLTSIEKAALIMEEYRRGKKHNPAPRRRGNPAPRIGTRNSRRRSQVTGRAPSRRLVSRRRRNSRRGFFPNPLEAARMQREAYADSGIHIDIGSHNMRRNPRRKSRRTVRARRARRSRLGAVPAQFGNLPFVLKLRGKIVAALASLPRAKEYARKLSRHERAPVAIFKR